MFVGGLYKATHTCTHAHMHVCVCVCVLYVVVWHLPFRPVHKALTISPLQFLCPMREPLQGRHPLSSAGWVLFKRSGPFASASSSLLGCTLANLFTASCVSLPSYLPHVFRRLKLRPPHVHKADFGKRKTCPCSRHQKFALKLKA